MALQAVQNRNTVALQEQYKQPKRAASSPPYNQPQLNNQHPNLLKRDILEATIETYDQAQEAQKELENQGAKLRKSFGETKNIAGKTLQLDRGVDLLIKETQKSCLRRLLQRCCSCCCRPETIPTDNQLELDAKVKMDLEKQLRYPKTPSSQPETRVDDDIDDYHSYVRLDRLERLMSSKGSKNWKRTLAPSPLEKIKPAKGGEGIWYRQMDISLTQLQRLAEDIGDSLDEQIRLANLLTIYLNYGADKVININDKLSIAQKTII